MGAFTSRMSTGVEEVDYSTTSAYRYPPKSGCYFGSYFIMGGERFDTTQPEAYLFGENQDLNFLGNRPMPFPYPAPQANEPTKTLKSLVNIRKDSLRFIKVMDEEIGAMKLDKADGEQASSTRYNIEFTFDTDVRVAITIFYFATEEISNGQAIYNPKNAAMNSETYHYKRGANQTFSQSTHIIDPSKFSEEEWQYNPDKDVIPVVIHCVVEDEPEHNGHSHITFAVVEKSTEAGYNLKPLKQKQVVDGLCYLLQEIYGIENKNSDRGKALEDDIDDNGSECVICMSDIRDTLILPCRHLCLCNCCADSLRYQANNCPICRAPFRALLQIRAMRKKLPSMPPQSSIPNGGAGGEENQLSQEGVPPGYEAVSLLEALNGPHHVSSPPNNNPHTEGTVPGIPLGTSLPTSPEDSPIMEKRKKSRQSSIRSRQSVAATLVEEAEESREEDVERSGTPEVNMTAIPEVVIKASKPEPPSDIPLSKSKNKTGNSPVGGRVPSVEIINETRSEKEEQTDASDVGAVGGEERPATPSPDYEDAIEGPMVMFAGPMVEVEVKKPHTSVMYVGQEESAMSSELEGEEDTCLPSQVPHRPSSPIETSGDHEMASKPPERDGGQSD